MSRFAPLLEEYPAYSTRKLFFRPRIVCARGPNNPPIEYTAQAAERLVGSEWGSITLCESLKPSTLVKPFFDYDAYLAVNPGEDELRAVVAKAKADLVSACELDDEEALAIATSHGPVVHDGQPAYKVSIHFYLQVRSARWKDRTGLYAHAPSCLLCYAGLRLQGL